MSGLVGGSISQIHSNDGPVTVADYPRLRGGPSAPAPDSVGVLPRDPADGDAEERRWLPVAGTVHQVPGPPGPDVMLRGCSVSAPHWSLTPVAARDRAACRAPVP